MNPAQVIIGLFLGVENDIRTYSEKKIEVIDDKLFVVGRVIINKFNARRVWTCLYASSKFVGKTVFQLRRGFF